jgi:hypothetical protein
MIFSSQPRPAFTFQHMTTQLSFRALGRDLFFATSPGSHRVLNLISRVCLFSSLVLGAFGSECGSKMGTRPGRTAGEQGNWPIKHGKAEKSARAETADPLSITGALNTMTSSIIRYSEKRSNVKLERERRKLIMVSTQRPSITAN